MLIIDVRYTGQLIRKTAMYFFIVAIVVKVISFFLILFFLWRGAQNFHKYTQIYQYLFFCRFPILFGLLLVIFPLLVLNGSLEELLGNLLQLGMWGNGVVAFFSMFTSWVVLFTLTRTLEIAPIKSKLPFVRTDTGYKNLEELRSLGTSFKGLQKLSSWIMNEKDAALSRLIAAGFLALPLVLTTIYCSSRTAGTDWIDWLLYAAGALIGVVLAFLVRWGYSPLEDRTMRQKFMMKPIDNLIHAIGDKFEFCGRIVLEKLIRIKLDEINEEKAQYVLKRQAQAIFFVLVVAGLYVGGGFLTSPAVLDSYYNLIPALVLVMVVHWIYCFIFSLLAVAFDSLRIPVISIFLLSIVLLYYSLETDYTYEIDPDHQVSLPAMYTDAIPDAYQAAAAWRGKRGSDSKQMVVVAASGGGIAAAQWTAEVLTRLDEGLYPNFHNGLALMSTTSGGSTGAMYYSDRFYSVETGKADTYELVRTSASSSSLTAAVRGLVYGDIWRFVPFASYFFTDRGNGLEDILEQRLAHPGSTVLGWAADVATGDRPAHVFNATMTETGSLMMISPLTFQTPFFQFRTEYPGYDVDVATAARLSATFPVISPQARPNRKYVTDTAYHLSDGGYFDNYGLLGALTFIDEAYSTAAARKDTTSLPRDVLLIQIEAFEQEKKVADPREGWKYALMGPVFTIFNMRNAAQRTRGEVEIDMLTRLMKARHNVNIKTVTFTLEGIDAPLSWHLNDSNRSEIRCVWKQQEESFRELRNALKVDSLNTPFNIPVGCN